MRSLSLLLLVATSATASVPATADTCGDLADKFADEDKRENMTIGEMDDLRLCVGEWMRDQVLQRSRVSNKQLSDAASNLPTAQTLQK
ncbi:hypothetical protein [Agitococcus lubricus]|uniref:Secreted protein n=1 Tax=Agitococcus lubricus TaxID=1077255 RepID=A0A2T5J2H5_9GAMM|nr:hypothetical protein [Agitococcus lubricus]PTQ90612.1 hypothetical protein C8N29_10210 [Agitococcus lubricus]